MAKTPDIPLITVLHGDAEVLKTRALRRLLAAHLDDATDEDALHQFWGKEVPPRDMAGAIGSASLFSDNRVVVLREFQMIPLREQKPLEGALSNLPQGTIVVIMSRPKEKDRDTRKAPLSAELTRLVKKVGKTELYLNPKKVDEMRAFVLDEITAGGKRIGIQSLNLLMQTVGADYDRMHQEIDKLIAYMGADPEISAQAVEACVLPEEERTVFNLTDAIGKRDVPAALEIIRILLPEEANRGEAIGVVAQITRHLRLLWQTNYALKKARSLDHLSDEITAVFPEEHNLAAEVRSKPFMARVLPQQARNFTEGQLARGMVKAYQADLALKGLSDEEMDERTLLETLVISLCRK
ncbi:MAG: DNA polymerase III subunit delta [Armatimonadia bacterium]